MSKIHSFSFRNCFELRILILILVSIMSKSQAMCLRTIIFVTICLVFDSLFDSNTVIDVVTIPITEVNAYWPPDFFLQIN